jgi:organic radical activating enzyme
MDPDDVAEWVDSVTPKQSRDRWVWITGGEPLDYDLRPLYKALRKRSFSIAVATSGKHRAITPVDWISVSYHGQKQFLQKYGSEIKLIVGLNGLDPFSFLEEFPDSETDFFYRYVQPLSVDGVEDLESLKTCLRFIDKNPNWSLSRQDHVYWGKK